MTKRMTQIFATLASAAFAGAALADAGHVTGHHNMPDQGGNMHYNGQMMGQFNHLDQDGDGKVTRGELAAQDEMSRQFKETVKERMGPNR